MPVLATAAFLGGHLLVLLVLAATAWVAGRVALSRFPLEDGAERLAVPLALGMALLGLLLLGLGHLELLARGPLVVLVVLIHLAGLGAWQEELGRVWALLADSRRRAAAVGLVAAAAPFFLLALYPPTAFDETLYHLPYAREFVRTGGVPFLPDLRYPVFPQLAEILCAAVLALTGSDVATHLVPWLATGTTAVLLIAWGRRVFTPAAGWLAAALYLGYPIVIYLAVTGYVEAELTLFVTAGLYALQRFQEERHAGWLVLAAVFAGSAAATKYLGLFFVAVFAVEVALAALPGQKVRAILRLTVLALVVLAPWYLRIWIHTGNPVFPFLPQVFGASAWTADQLTASAGLGERLADLPRFPWDVLFEREKVGFQPPFSPAFLLGLPLVVTGAWRDRRLRRLTLLALAYVLAALALPPDVRYLAAVLPALSLVLAAELTVLMRRGSVRALLCLVALLPSWAWAGYRFLQQGPLPVTAAQGDRYLRQELPVWPALRFLNRTRGSDYTVYAFHAESMSYFAEGRFLGDWNGPARYARLTPFLDDPAALWRELRRLEVDYLLVARGTGVRLPVRDPVFEGLFRTVYSDEASEIYELSPFDRRSTGP